MRPRSINCNHPLTSMRSSSNGLRLPRRQQEQQQRRRPPLQGRPSTPHLLVTRRAASEPSQSLQQRDASEPSQSLQQLLQTLEDVRAYVAGQPSLRSILGGGDSARWSVEEVRGGVINAAWAVRGDGGDGEVGGDSPGFATTNNAVFLKQAPPYVRAVGPSFPLSTERTRVEAAAMEWLQSIDLPAAGAVPPLLHYDERRAVIATALLAPPGHVPLQRALRDGAVFPGLAPSLAATLAAVFASTSASALGDAAHAARAEQFRNAEIVDANEAVVLAGPFDPRDPNNAWLSPEMDADVRAFWDDGEAIAAAASARELYRSSSSSSSTGERCLIHNDLHCLNILAATDAAADADAAADDADPTRARARATIIDWEFATFGPAAYDIGCLIASLLIAAVAAALGGLPDGPQATRAAQRDWLLASIEELYRGTVDEWWQRLQQQQQQQRGKEEQQQHQQRQEHQKRVASEVLAFAGCCAGRYVVGRHDHELLSSLPDRGARVECERAVLRISRRMLRASREGASAAPPSSLDAGALIASIAREECKRDAL